MDETTYLEPLRNYKNEMYGSWVQESDEEHMEDFSREKGPYAIIQKGDRFGIVEVLKRDKQGNVQKHKPNVLSYLRTPEEGQALLDNWKRIDNSSLIERFEAWQG